MSVGRAVRVRGAVGGRRAVSVVYTVCGRRSVGRTSAVCGRLVVGWRPSRFKNRHQIKQGKVKKCSVDLGNISVIKSCGNKMAFLHFLSLMIKG